MNDFTKFLIRLAIVAAVFVGLDLLILPQFGEQFPSLWIFITIGFLIGTAALVHYILLKSRHGRPQQFVNYFMGSITFKMFVGLLFAVVMALADRENIKVHLIHFLCLYMVLLVTEVLSLLKSLK